ncbi:MAG TPA: hypothetical protein PLV12_04900 [Saprospiraceae bacterium]|nr:hypothetical protein [Saprospiraceae bacterium]
MEDQRNLPQIKVLTIKDIILTLKDYFLEIVRNYTIIIVASIPFLCYYIYNFYNTKPTYFAEVKFLVEGSSSSIGGLGGLLGQFGLRNTGKSNPYKIVEVAKSKAILEKVLFSKYDNEFTSNHIINIYKLNEKWAENEPDFAGFKFNHSKYIDFDSIEKIAFVRLINKVTGGKESSNYMINFTLDSETGVYSYKTNSENEQLAIHLQNASYEFLRRFFEEDILENSVKTTVVLKQKADSLQNLLVNKTYQLANLQDRTLGLVMATPGVRKMALEKEIQALTLAYAEVLKSYELSDINLKDSKPLFLKLDESISPLESISPSIIINIIKALVLSVLFSGGLIVIRKLYRDIMAETVN